MTIKPKFNVNRIKQPTSSRFKIKWENQYVADFNIISPLNQAKGEQNTNLCLKGKGAIILEQGILYNSGFIKWVSLQKDNPRSEKRLSPVLPKNIIIEAYNEVGKMIFRYKLLNSWVSEFQALPELDTNSNTIAIQSLKLENESWEKDTTINEPNEKPI
jgi:phage tail-like protein